MTSGSDRLVSDARTITEGDLHFWAGLMNDWNPVHVDLHGASMGPFGQRIVHGNVALNLAASFDMPPELRASPGGVSVSGWTNVRFINPVFVGDTIRIERTIEGLACHVRVLNHEDVAVLVGTLHFENNG